MIKVKQHIRKNKSGKVSEVRSHTRNDYPQIADKIYKTRIDFENKFDFNKMSRQVQKDLASLRRVRTKLITDRYLENPQRSPSIIVEEVDNEIRKIKADHNLSEDITYRVKSFWNAKGQPIYHSIETNEAYKKLKREIGE